MPRLIGVNLPENKRIEIALTSVYGIGRSLSQKILRQARVDLAKRASQLTLEEMNRIKEVIEKNYKIEGELRREVMMSIKRLEEIGSRRGLRHMHQLPVRGQRTRTNSRTVRGNVRRTVATSKKAAPSPT